MAVTIVKQPTGHKIIDQAIAAAITDSGGDALVTFLYHGLGTGDTVYITTDIDEYNGFWHVTAIDANTFKISESATADFVEYFQDAAVDFYETSEHVWSSVFLPIVYKLSNDRWPVNSVDSNGLILLNGDDNGFTFLFLVAPLPGGLTALQFVKISGATNEEANGVFQVVEIINNVQFVIDLPSSLAGNLIGKTVQYYYNNYQVKVKIYAGLPLGHPWQAKKPYVEVAELSLTPDDNNIVMFSVSDYIKSKVAIKNNTTLFSLPLNLDAFTGFYIATSETYDDSDGYSLTIHESSFVDDDFQGFAIAGKLPFKNLYSGDYADYVYTDSNPAKWLTLFTSLVGVEGKYFDISFIKSVIGDFTLTLNKYVSDYLTTIEVINFTDQGVGVYRIPIALDSVYDIFCAFISTLSSTPSPDVIVAITLPALSTWTSAGGAGTAWTTGATPTVNLIGSGLPGVSSEYLIADYAFITGRIYKVGFRYTKDYNSGSSNPRAIILAAMDSFNNVIFSQVEATPFADGTQYVVLIFTATSQTTRLGITSTDGSNVDIDINALQPQLLANSEFDDASVWTPADWILGSGVAEVTIFSGDSGILLQNITGTVAGTYSCQYLRTSTGYDVPTDSSTMGITFYDDTGTLIGSASLAEFITANNTSSFVHTFTTVVPVRRIQIINDHNTGSDMTISFAFIRLYGPPTETTPGIPAITGAQITQEICIDIIEDCEAQGGFTPSDIRLLEDGSYRLLE